jgi:arylsulfatase A-like enzyme
MKRIVLRWSAFLGVMLAVAAGDARGEVSRQPPRPPNIVFVLIDTLRPDHLGCYGYARNTSPNIDRIAAQGVLFEKVFSVAPWTNPTIASLFTGRYPQAIFPPAKHRDAIRQALPEQLETLAERLKREGYRTAALVDHPGISRRWNYDQGFDTWVPLFHKGGFRVWGVTNAEFISREFDAVLARGGKAPVFVYLHLVYPHRPYIPPPPRDILFGPGFKRLEESEKQGVVNRYDGEIRYTDDLVGMILESLKRRGILKRTAVVITADHGEGFWEHGLAGHGNSLFNELLRVPLIVSLPGSGRGVRRRVEQPVSNIDLYPTLLDLAGAAPPPGTDGRSLLRYLGPGGHESEPGWVFSESPHSGYIQGAACMRGNLKYIQQGFGHEALYDLEKDPEERVNLLGRAPIHLEMEERLSQHRLVNERRRAALTQLRIEPDAETRERLRALGYVD